MQHIRFHYILNDPRRYKYSTFLEHICHCSTFAIKAYLPPVLPLLMLIFDLLFEMLETEYCKQREILSLLTKNVFCNPHLTKVRRHFSFLEDLSVAETFIF